MMGSTAAVDDDADDTAAHTYIYHEKQESSLCGQHALNALLIGHYYSPVDLAEFAHQLDAQERELMLAAGADTDDAIKFLAEVHVSVKPCAVSNRHCKGVQ